MTDHPRAGLMAKRIQRKRTKGWKMPPNTVYVGRPTKWGNPWAVGESDPQIAVDKFEEFVRTQNLLFPIPWEDIRGKNLACWCPLDKPCHADILLKLANPSPHPIPEIDR